MSNAMPTLHVKTMKTWSFSVITSIIIESEISFEAWNINESIDQCNWWLLIIELGKLGPVIDDNFEIAFAALAALP